MNFNVRLENPGIKKLLNIFNNGSNKFPNANNFPSKLNSTLTLWVLVIFSLMVIAAAAWNGIILYQDLSKTKKNEIRLHQLSGKIIFFDEALTMSARLAAAQNDLVWEKRYQIYEKK